MSWAGISVRDAMQKLRQLDGGWYLPYIQRQYVWGKRYESEDYVCLLLDSLLNRYPIGGPSALGNYEAGAIQESFSATTNRASSLS